MTKTMMTMIKTVNLSKCDVGKKKQLGQSWALSDVFLVGERPEFWTSLCQINTRRPDEWMSSTARKNCSKIPFHFYVRDMAKRWTVQFCDMFGRGPLFNAIIFRYCLLIWLDVLLSKVDFLVSQMQGVTKIALGNPLFTPLNKTLATVVHNTLHIDFS